MFAGKVVSVTAGDAGSIILHLSRPSEIPPVIQITD